MSTRNPVSSANFLGHPIHPMLVLFPVAFFVATFASDIVFWWTGHEIWANAAIWLLGTALVMAALAALAGLTDFIGDPRIRQINDAWQHAIGNVVAVLISLFSFYVRYRYGSSVIVPLGLILSLVVVCILLYTGMEGRRIGVSASGCSVRRAAALTG